MKTAALFLLLGAITTVPLAGQGMGTTPTTGGGGQTSVQASPNFGSASSSRPIYISGKVIQQDGSAMPQVIVERVCGGIAKTVAYTDSKGHFSFQWGDRSMIVSDASDAGTGRARTNAGGFGSAQSAGGANSLASDPFGNRMMNCELRADVVGFSSDSVELFNRRLADQPDIGAIVIHRIAGVEGSSISVTSMMAPKAAKKAYEQGLHALLKSKPEDAAKDFEKAVSLYPQYADAWVNLGKVRLGEQAIEPARVAMKKALEADPKEVAPYMELGLLAAKDANWKESGQYLDRAVELDPVDYPQAWYADAVANFNLAKYDAAEKSARAAVKLDPRHANPRSSYLLGLVLEQKRDYAGAAAELAAFIKLSPTAPDLAQAEAQLGRLQKLAGESKSASAKP